MVVKGSLRSLPVTTDALRNWRRHVDAYAASSLGETSIMRSKFCASWFVIAADHSPSGDVAGFRSVD
jgi:hypothetical protein